MKAINPATGKPLQDHPEPGRDEVMARVARAGAAQAEWREVPVARRAEALAKAAGVLRSKAGDHARLMAGEMGKPVTQGKAEVEKCAWALEHYADHAASYLAARPVETEAQKSYVRFDPLGLILAVMPWNFPYWQVVRAAAPALAAGNGILLKHADGVPGCALALERLFTDAGLPEDLFSTLLVGHDLAGELIDHPVVAAATLTGSTRAGRAVGERAGKALKKVVLELGGSDPYLVLADADVPKAATTCADSRMINGGQSCIAAKRFIVEAPVYDAFLEAFVAAMGAYEMGDPLDDATRLGPMARHSLRDELHAQVTRSIGKGAKRVLGGKVPDGPGAYYPPTVLADVPPGCPAWEDELFGPAAAVIRARDEAEAVAIANGSAFGLGAAVFTADIARGERVAARLEAGSVAVNDFVRSDPRMPFGGVKASGHGRELSVFGIREFVNVKGVVVAG